MRFIKDTDIPFMSQMRFGFTLSGIIILAGLVAMIMNGGPKLSIDFEGGTMIAVRFSEPVDVNMVREAMGKINIEGQTYNFSKNEIKNFGAPTDISARIPIIENAPENFAQKIVTFLYDQFPGSVPVDRNVFLLEIKKLDPKVGTELSGDVILAILSALGLILLYISIRFQFHYALGAIAALAHDILITLGIFSILGFEISLPVIAAFLTIVGYSLNDTIVIFDRIRENVKTNKRDPFLRIVDISINESLNRTVITSLTTFIVVFVLYAFGGVVIHTFAFAMLIGVIVGTYSSIYVASPVMALLQKGQTDASTKK